ncbi:MarC family protein [Paludibacter sp. 221]|uniref:MarC family protein n=1 Tax=Paludibacter sp. 221 TaxID=2302939 RepID=UPI0013D0457D|nr:MarC family protein [Paludibacter sp. 221]NDV47431.1 MarC family protein [Paludibacter sp. 221]
MNFSITQIASAFMVFFPIIDILGSIPIVLKIKEKDKINAFQTCTVAFIILVVFLFAGNWILDLFNVNIESFAVAGALVIFIYAIEMLLDIEIFKNKGPEGSASIVPLAFPLIAGPGVFTTSLSMKASYDVENIIIGLLLNIIFVFIVLKSTDKIEKIFGQGGIYIIRKFFGIILLAFSVKLFAENLSSLLH